MTQKTYSPRLMFLALFLVIGLFHLLLPRHIDAKYQFDFTPSIYIREAYDDNVELDSIDEKSDFITTVSPALQLDILSEKNKLSLSYAPSFVWYRDETRLNTIRHFGDIEFSQELAKHFRFDLTDTILRSEDPLQDFGDDPGQRTFRFKYWRNSGQASVSYLFGPEDAWSLGYRNNYQANDDPTLFDGAVQTPFTSLTYWFTQQNGLAFDYEYTDSALSSPFEVRDFTGHRVGGRYLRRFTPQSTGYFDYHFTSRDFSAFRENYDVHEIAAGYEQALTSDLNFAVALGYFLQDNEVTDDNAGLQYDLSLNKAFQHASFTFGGNGGWGEQYLDPTRRQFIQFWGLYTNLQYQIMDSLNFYIAGNYRSNQDQDDRTWSVWRGNVGFRWTFLRWLALVIDYAHTERSDDVPRSEYNDNRVMLTFTATRLFKW